MFEGLQDKLQGVFRSLRSEGRISEDHVRRAVRQIRLALLEADVHVRVVRSFVGRVQELALGEEVLSSLTPDQQMIRIVRDELIAVLGEPGAELQFEGRPAVVLLCGLQGSGKTTAAGKLAVRLRGQGRNPVLAAGDLQRAAAVEQLRQVGAAAGATVIEPAAGEDLPAFSNRALAAARDGGFDTLIFDTAGRLHVDAESMAELTALAERVDPCETLFVCDAMTGQDAVRSAAAFAEGAALTGAVMTKLDGDARGGAALSLRGVTQVPLRFVGVGEKLEDLELFAPDRIASRILGMGDVLSLIEKAERVVDRQETERLAERIARQEFTLEDLRDQLRQLRRMGPLSQFLELLPGQFRGANLAGAMDESRLVAITALIDSMTPRERRNPAILNASRRRRIARGSGRTVQELNQLLRQYRQMLKLMKRTRGKWMQGIRGV
ncbi:MAG: signal recognition particle protein [Holophagales bacterium]|nr:signal recognition particle protein [Holophagales bacterium]MYG30677.1 signal recognition particle protein [Holophagales bacterium]MYI81617.1 signal recognition particle protein [Holophagales bacterium]